MPIHNATFVISSPDVAQCPKSTLPEYAFIGRSNVGKSSLINMLCHNPRLAKTSQKPGKTLLINHFIIDNSSIHQSINSHVSGASVATQVAHQWHLVDLPGYGFAQTSQRQRELLRKMIERYCLLREQLTNLFVLVDCRLEPQKIDLEFMNWLGENEIPFSIVFTKADKVGKGRLSENIDHYKQSLLQTWEELPPIFITSAETGMGRDELINYIEEINNQITQ